jgi:hypothetical protein
VEFDDGANIMSAEVTKRKIDAEIARLIKAKQQLRFA